MSVTMEIREEGRVLLLIYSDPVTMQEIGDLLPANIAHRDSVQHTVHTVFDFTHFHRPPQGLLRARYAPVFTHPRSGKMIVFGAIPLARGIVLQAAQFTNNAHKVYFFEHETDAWVYMRKTIADDIQAEGST